MKLERKVNLGGFNSMGFQSSDRATPQECARDLIAQMQAMVKAYPILQRYIDETKAAYGV